MEQSSNVCSAWLCRLQIETNNTSQTDQAWPQLNSQNQMKHNVQRNEQHSSRYNSKMYRGHVADPNSDPCSEDSLDMSEYPELGEKKVKIKNTPDIVMSCNQTVKTENLTTHVTTKVKHRHVGGPNSYKRAEKISFDLKKALESAKYFVGKNSKRPLKLRVNMYKINTKACNKNSQNDKGVEIKKVKVFNIKPRKPSRLKRKILLERWTNRQMQCLKCKVKKMKANATDVNSINFNSLKIISDPEIDIDYVKRMSTLTVYDNDYRDLKVENIPEDTVQFRPDVTEKLNDLRISNLGVRNISTTPYRNALYDTNDITSLQHGLSLKDEDDVDCKSDIKILHDKNDLIKYSKNFREYCNNIITPSLNESLEKFLSEIRRLQTKLYDRDQNKGKYKRRYYTGLKEVQKHVALKKVRFVVIAPDIEKIRSEGGLDDEIDKLLEICRKNETVFCFGLRRRKLGYYAHGNGLVGCIAITNYGNAEQLFWNVLVEIAEARNKFEELRGRSERTIDVSKIIHENGLLAENIGTLLKTLALIN